MSTMGYVDDIKVFFLLRYKYANYYAHTKKCAMAALYQMPFVGEGSKRVSYQRAVKPFRFFMLLAQVFDFVRWFWQSISFQIRCALDY